MTLIQRHIAPGMSASAQALYSSLGMGAAMGLTMALSGWLYESLGGQAFWVMAGLSFGSLCLAIGRIRSMPPSTNFTLFRRSL